MALFQKETGTRFTLVPYRGFPPEMQDLVAGRIDFAFDLPVQLPLMRARNIKVYAVTSDARLAQAPDIPTMREMGLPSVSYSTWQALFAPKNVSQETVGKLNAAAVEALADQGVRSRMPRSASGKATQGASQCLCWGSQPRGNAHATGVFGMGPVV